MFIAELIDGDRITVTSMTIIASENDFPMLCVQMIDNKTLMESLKQSYNSIQITWRE